tara:strand:- start:13062 stop:13268 length:207 start_codon:yes stop_codon:yes gene_type:complete
MCIGGPKMPKPAPMALTPPEPAETAKKVQESDAERRRKRSRGPSALRIRRPNQPNRVPGDAPGIEVMY